MLKEDRSYREGEVDAPVLMLSVAGSAEQAEGRPAAGAAKRHLKELLARLHARRPDLAPYPDPDMYPMLNAHPGVEYMALTGRTEPPVAEYTSAQNAARLNEYVKGRPVIAFGGRALKACRAAKIVPVMFGRHPSSLNRIRNGDVVAATGQERMAKRYDMAAEQLLRTARC